MAGAKRSLENIDLSRFRYSGAAFAEQRPAVKCHAGGAIKAEGPEVKENADAPISYQPVVKSEKDTQGPVAEEVTAPTGSVEGTIRDILQPGLYVVFIGFNPGLESGRTGHHYAHRSNRFWKFLYASKLVDRAMTPAEDADMPGEYGYGFTDLVPRCTRGISELTPHEMREGAIALEERIASVLPDYVCIVGKGIWQTICKVKGWSTRDFEWGLQPPSRLFGGASVFVVPSTSGLVSLPAEQQLGYWRQLHALVEGVRPDKKASAFD